MPKNASAVARRTFIGTNEVVKVTEADPAGKDTQSGRSHAEASSDGASDRHPKPDSEKRQGRRTGVRGAVTGRRESVERAESHEDDAGTNHLWETIEPMVCGTDDGTEKGSAATVTKNDA